MLLLRSGKSIPRELLVMGVLKVLGKGLDFEELETGSFVSKSSHHSFFHKFLEKFTATQYSKYVHTHTHPVHWKSSKNVWFRMLGWVSLVP